MFRKLRFVIAGIALIAANQAVSFAVSASMPESLRPAGSTRYAAVGSSTLALTTQTAFSDLADMTTSITIPAGKHGDVFVLFCGETFSLSVTKVRAIIAGQESNPIQLQDSTSGAQSRCASFFRFNVPEGSKNVRVQWAGSTATVQSMNQRSMIVIVNLH